jgi:hypothetical protein
VNLQNSPSSNECFNGHRRHTTADLHTEDDTGKEKNTYGKCSLEDTMFDPESLTGPGTTVCEKSPNKFPDEKYLYFNVTIKFFFLPHCNSPPSKCTTRTIEKEFPPTPLIITIRITDIFFCIRQNRTGGMSE